jgi:hypothetical protein
MAYSTADKLAIFANMQEEIKATNAAVEAEKIGAAREDAWREAAVAQFGDALVYASGPDSSRIQLIVVDRSSAHRKNTRDPG